MKLKRSLLYVAALLSVLSLSPLASAQSGLGGGIFSSTSVRTRTITFTQLGAPVNGSYYYCSDCAATAPCTSGGTGAFAYRVAGAWNCTTGSGGGSAPFSDATAIVKNSTDATKALQFSLSGVTTANTIPVTVGGTATAATFSFPGSVTGVRLITADASAADVTNAQLQFFSGGRGFTAGQGGIEYTNGTHGYQIFSNVGVINAAGSVFGWSSSFTELIASPDTGISRDAAGVVQINGGTADTTKGGYKVIADTSGSYYTAGSATELLTLSTSGATTTTVGSLVPANAHIEAILYRITTTITTATAFTVKVTSGAAAFVNIGSATSSQSVMTAGTTKVLVPSTLADQYNTSATTLTVSTTGTPGAGAIRLTVIYSTFSAPTS